MRNFIKVVCVIMALACLLSMPVYADDGSAYSSAFFAAYDSFLRNPSGTIIRIWFDVMGNGTMDEIGASSIVLQRSSDGINWTAVKTFLPENYPKMICENTGLACDYVVYSGYSGYYYRAYVEFYAKNSRGTGYIWDYSEVIYLQSS